MISGGYCAILLLVMADALSTFNARRAGLPLGETLTEMGGAFVAQHMVRRYGGPAGLEYFGIPAEFVYALGAGLVGSMVGGEMGRTLGRAGRGSAVSWAGAAGAATGIAAHIAHAEKAAA